MQPNKIKLPLKDKHNCKSVTSQDLRNVKSELKALQKHGRYGSKIVANTVTELLSSNTCSKVKIVSDNKGDV
jgi:hypothetical protein